MQPRNKPSPTSLMHFSTFKELTRLEHSLFGLPFLFGALLLVVTEPEALSHISWVALGAALPAFFLARIAGMAFNQLIDRHLDAQNPRTQNRVLPSGRMRIWQARAIAWGALLSFLLLCFQINVLTALLALLAAFLIYLYSYMKRLHASCHLVLGAIHFLVPVMVSAALVGEIKWPPLFLGLVALSLIFGNDICYAIQDYAFDRSQQLRSLPVRFGVARSLEIAASVHALSLFFLFAIGWSAELHVIFFFIIPFLALFFFFFHRRLQKQVKQGLGGIERFFFWSNVTVSFSSLIFIVLSILWDVLL